MMILLYLVVFIFGAVVGSFLNCALCRMEHKKSFIKGSSFCPKCNHKLAWFDLIPIFSFLLLKRKCRYCHDKISFQYLITEIATGLLFLLLFYFIGFNFKLIYCLIIFCLLEMIFIHDLKHYIIPDRLIFSLIGIVLIFNILNFFVNCKLKIENCISLFHIVMAIVVSAGFFFLIWLISQGKWMGFGDVKLALFMGLFLGWPAILPALFFAFIFGSVVGLILIANKKKKLKSQVPFGPFLITGTLFAFFLGQKVINWYLNLIL